MKFFSIQSHQFNYKDKVVQVRKKTNIIPKRAFSCFDSKVSTLDGGLIEVHKERALLDKAIVALLVKELCGKAVTAFQIATRFNRKHPNANVKPSHIRHSLKMIMRDMPRVIRRNADGLYHATKESIVVLATVRYNRLNDK